MPCLNFYKWSATYCSSCPHCYFFGDAVGSWLGFGSSGCVPGFGFVDSQLARYCPHGEYLSLSFHRRCTFIRCVYVYFFFSKTFFSFRMRLSTFETLGTRQGGKRHKCKHFTFTPHGPQLRIGSFARNFQSYFFGFRFLFVFIPWMLCWTIDSSLERD